MAIFEKAGKLYKQFPIVFIAAAIFLIVPLAVYASLTTAHTGTRSVCKYDHVISDNTKELTVFRWNAGTYKVKMVKSVCDAHKDLDILKSKIQEAKKRGDREQVNALQKLVQETSIESKNASSKSTGGRAGRQPVFSGDLIALFPSSIEGYTMLSETPGSITASRMYNADPKVHPTIKFLTIELSQLNRDTDARDWIQQNIQSYYGADSRTTSVNGADAYFGTDGSEYAVLAYHINGVAFKVELLANGGQPKNLFDEIVDVGDRVP